MPAKPQKDHPTYIDMVVVAIGALKERTGSSRQAIIKYIVANYKLSENTTNTHVKLALKRGVANGLLKQMKGTGASGSFKVIKPEKPKKAAAKPKKPVSKPAKKPAAKKSTKPKKKPATKAAGKKASPAKKTKKPAKKPAAKKSPAAKKPAKKPTKPSAKKSPKKAAAKKQTKAKK